MASRLDAKDGDGIYDITIQFFLIKFYRIYRICRICRILFEYLPVCTRLAEVAKDSKDSKDLTTAKKVTSSGAQPDAEIITGLRVQCITN